MEFRTLAGPVEGEELRDLSHFTREMSAAHLAFYGVAARYAAEFDRAAEGAVLDWGRNPYESPEGYVDSVRRGFQKAAEESLGRLGSLRVWVLHASPSPWGGWHLAGQQTLGRWLFSELLRQSVPLLFDPAWRTPDVLALACAVREDGAFDRLPVLADALMDAGCTLAPLLDHCRADCDHGPACWAADLVLGTELPRV